MLYYISLFFRVGFGCILAFWYFLCVTLKILQSGIYLNVFGVCNLLLFLLLCDLLIALVLYDLLVALLHFLFFIFLSCGQSCDLILCCVYKDGVMHGFIV